MQKKGYSFQVNVVPLGDDLKFRSIPGKLIYVQARPIASTTSRLINEVFDYLFEKYLVN